MLLINELHWSKQCWKLSLKCFVILSLRKEGSRTQPDYLTEVPWGRSLLPPQVPTPQPELSGKSQDLAIRVLGMVIKPICLPIFRSSIGSLCYSSALPPSLVPLLGVLDIPGSDTWQGLAEMGEAEAWPGSSHSPCQSGYEEFMQVKAYQPWGGQRWSRVAGPELGSRRSHVWLELRLW